ncbi:MAG: hypothetical protein U5P10_16455 [Spirochaetia bacterium]|nr:hypothetical protein [Spirochaetia bacterium]
MKRVLIFMLIWFLSVNIVTAQEIDRYYMRNRLEIDVKEETFGTYNTIGSTSGIYTGTTVKKVRYYQGFDKISEPEFLIIAGLDEEAEKARKFHKTNRTYNNIGWALLGTTVAALGFTLYYDDRVNGGDYGEYVESGIVYDRNELMLQIAHVSTLTLGLSTIISIIISWSRGDHWMPVNQANEIKIEYNNSLKNK